MPKKYQADESDEEKGCPKSKEEHKSAYVQWIYRNGVYRPAGGAVAKIVPGIYTMENDNTGWFLSPCEFPSDKLLRLPGMPIEFILDQINKFWDRRELFENVGLLHKRGILMYGPAGCGKTSIIRLLSDDIVKRGGIVLMITNCRLSEEVLRGVRQIEPDRPILTIIEDIETFMGQAEESSSARALLSFLDGETQVNHIVHLATTNKPQELEDRIVKRPGRFDVIVQLLQPVRGAREAYLRNILKDFMAEREFQAMVNATEGMGLAHLREVIVAHYCLGHGLQETLKRLKGNIKDKLKISKGDDHGLGFSVDFVADEDR